MKIYERYVLIGAAIKEAREELSMDETDLGDMIGTDKMSVYFYERGQRRISVEGLERVAHALKKPVSFFLNYGADDLESYENRRVYYFSPKVIKLAYQTLMWLAERGFYVEPATTESGERTVTHLHRLFTRMVVHAADSEEDFNFFDGDCGGIEGHDDLVRLLYTYFFDPRGGTNG